MTIVDFNVHLAPTGDFADELDFRRFDPVASLDRVARRLDAAEVDVANIMVLDTDLLRRDANPLLEDIGKRGYHATVMIDPREADAAELVDEAARAGVSGLKFHPYFLKLEDRDFPKAVEIARHAAERGLWIAVCCSYGTIDVYRIGCVRLLIEVCREIQESPVIALHSGGALILDVMSVAFDCDNLLLETSFSLPFWIGSSVERDFAFALKKLGSSRWVFGSDHPYADLAESQRVVRDFMARHGFAPNDVEQLMGRTARERLLP